MKRFTIISLANMIMCFASACNSHKDEEATTVTDKSMVDSMPVVRPNISDSGAVIITPPVNDSNVIVPDTAGKK